MFRHLKSGTLGLALFAMIFFTISELSAAPRRGYNQKSYSTRSYAKKSYSKKAPYAGYGKPSKANGLPKCKITSGHVKKTNKGYTYVNPYARSK